MSLPNNHIAEQYNSLVAKHYAAYRPPFHQLILTRVISEDESFRTGLDIGCGTGYSSIALSKYCEQVFGLDSNESMLDKSSERPKITYICGSGDDLSFVPVQSIDIVSFAGSLYYTKSEILRIELLKACNPEAVIIVYDFEILIEKAMADIGIESQFVSSNYNHAINISDWTCFLPETVAIEQIYWEFSSTELAHIMLADSNRLKIFSEKFQGSDPCKSIVDYFKSNGLKHRLYADIYFSRYRISLT